MQGGPGQPQGPGLLGTTAMATGLGSPTYQQQMMANQQAQLMIGAGSANVLGNWAWPIGTTVAMGASWGAGHALQGAAPGALGQLVGGAMKLPTDLPFTPMRMGWNLGGGMAGRSAGMAGRIAGRVAQVGLGAAGLGVGMAAFEGVTAVGTEAWKGANYSMQGQAALGAVARPGMHTSAAQGESFGRMGRDLEVEAGDLKKLTQSMDQMKLFQASRDMKEFQARFKEVLTAVKEIAKTTQTSVDEALGMFGELRNQGFYNVQDNMGQAKLMKARGAASGMSQQQVYGMGQVGAQMARSHGMYGKHGSELLTRTAASTNWMLQRGMLDEETVMEHGGPDALAARMANTQMAFLKSSRGIAMIASTMGADGKPDPGRLGQMLGGGMTTESVVERAAMSGMGTLSRAQSRKSREAMLPFAGMGVVAMAASQEKQLTGSITRQGTINMMSTIPGIGGKEEAGMWLDQQVGQARYMQAERREQAYASEQENWMKSEDENSKMSRFGRWGRNSVFDTDVASNRIGRAAASAMSSTSRTFGRLMERGGFRAREYTHSAEGMESAREWARSGGEMFTRSTKADDEYNIGRSRTRSKDQGVSIGFLRGRNYREGLNMREGTGAAGENFAGVAESTGVSIEHQRALDMALKIGAPTDNGVARGDWDLQEIFDMQAGGASWEQMVKKYGGSSFNDTRERTLGSSRTNATEMYGEKFAYKLFGADRRGGGRIMTEEKAREGITTAMGNLEDELGLAVTDLKLLGDDLTRGKAGPLFSKWMKLKAKGDQMTDKEIKEARALENELVDGGALQASSVEGFQEVRKGLEKGDVGLLRRMSAAWAADGKDGVGSLSYINATRENTNQEKESLRRYSRNRTLSGATSSSKDEANLHIKGRQLASAYQTGSRTNRLKATEGLYQQIFSDDDFSDKERQALGSMFGGRAGAAQRLGDSLQSLISGEGKGLQQTLNQLGSGVTASSLEGMSAADRKQEAFNIMSSGKDGIDLSLGDGPTEGKNVEGALASFIAAGDTMTQMTTAMSSFLTKHFPEYNNTEGNTSVDAPETASGAADQRAPAAGLGNTIAGWFGR